MGQSLTSFMVNNFFLHKKKNIWFNSNTIFRLDAITVTTHRALARTLVTLAARIAARRAAARHGSAHCLCASIDATIAMFNETSFRERGSTMSVATCNTGRFKCAAVLRRRRASWRGGGAAAHALVSALAARVRARRVLARSHVASSHALGGQSLTSFMVNNFFLHKKKCIWFNSNTIFRLDAIT